MQVDENKHLASNTILKYKRQKEQIKRQQCYCTVQILRQLVRRDGSKSQRRGISQWQKHEMLMKLWRSDLPRVHSVVMCSGRHLQQPPATSLLSLAT